MTYHSKVVLLLLTSLETIITGFHEIYQSCGLLFCYGTSLLERTNKVVKLQRSNYRLNSFHFTGFFL